jgi:hypothetical protein
MLGQFYQLRRGHFLHFQYIIDYHATTREDKVSELLEQREIHCKLIRGNEIESRNVGFFITSVLVDTNFKFLYVHL